MESTKTKIDMLSRTASISNILVLTYLGAQCINYVGCILLIMVHVQVNHKVLNNAHNASCIFQYLIITCR